MNFFTLSILSSFIKSDCYGEYSCVNRVMEMQNSCYNDYNCQCNSMYMAEQCRMECPSDTRLISFVNNIAGRCNGHGQNRIPTYIPTASGIGVNPFGLVPTHAAAISLRNSGDFTGFNSATLNIRRNSAGSFYSIGALSIVSSMAIISALF